MVKLFVLVYQITLVVHQLVVLSVLSVLSALKIRLVLIKSVSIRVLAHAELTQIVMYEIIVQFVAVHLVILATHSVDVIQYHVRKNLKTLGFCCLP